MSEMQQNTLRSEQYSILCWKLWRSCSVSNKLHPTHCGEGHVQQYAQKKF